MNRPQLVVDPIACDGFGYCAELLPEMVSLDEWGYPVVSGEPVPPALVDLAKSAARQCPRRAFHVVTAGRAVRVAVRPSSRPSRP